MRVILAAMDDGGEHELAQFADVCEVEEALLPVVPAAPDYTCLLYFAHDPPVVERFPVLAWRIDGAEASPVTFEGYAEAGNIVGAGTSSRTGASSVRAKSRSQAKPNGQRRCCSRRASERSHALSRSTLYRPRRPHAPHTGERPPVYVG
jgi:hypothetical protein